MSGPIPKLSQNIEYERHLSAKQKLNRKNTPLQQLQQKRLESNWTKKTNNKKAPEMKNHLQIIIESCKPMYCHVGSENIYMSEWIVIIQL